MSKKKKGGKKGGTTSYSVYLFIIGATDED